MRMNGYLLAAVCLAAAAAVSYGAKSNQVERRKCGSAKVLKDSVYIFNIFLNDPSSTWTDQSRGVVSNRMNETIAFLLAEARKYNVKVEFTQEWVETTCDFEIPTDMNDLKWTQGAIAKAARELEHPEERRAVASVVTNTSKVVRAPKQAATSKRKDEPRGSRLKPEASSLAKTRTVESEVKPTGLDSGNALAEYIKKRYKADHVTVLLHVEKGAISYNISCYGQSNGRWECESSVMYTSYRPGKPTSSGSYAHEILHNFGAGELYFPFDSDSIRKDKAKKLWPKDVMGTMKMKIADLNIGPYTAWRIGWTDEMKPEFGEFND